MGQKIRTIRRNKHLKIRELADLAGLSEDYMGKIERGDGKSSLETIVTIANALEVGVDILIANDLVITTPLNADINSILDNMEKTKRKCFLEFIKLNSNFFNHLDIE